VQSQAQTCRPLVQHQLVLICTFSVQALQRQHDLNEVLEVSEDGLLQAIAGGRKADTDRAEITAAAELKENQPPATARSHKQKKDVVQYSRRPVPSAKQKEQAAHSQHLLEMKEYFAEVHRPITAFYLMQKAGHIAVASMHAAK